MSPPLTSPPPATPAGWGPTDGPSDAEVLRALEAWRGRRIAVALSGGVDSAAAAARLREVGADVVGLALRLHDPDPNNPMAPRACCPPDDLQDARRVCEVLDVPFYVLDGREAFDAGVVRPFVRDYVSGRTPNPCVGCNAFVKLERLTRRARALGCEALATGHYARSRPPAVGGGPRLYAGADTAKDQSYFLFSTPSAVLAQLVFPLGAWTKAQARALVHAAGLPVGHKRESQEVCFVGGAGAGAFVRRQPEARALPPGRIRDESGRDLGAHAGISHFTVGQRKGLGVAAGRRLHVLSIDPASHTVTVGPPERLRRSGLTAARASWPRGAPPGGPFEARVQIRYRDPGTRARVTPLADGRVAVEFEQPVRAVAPGQAAVFRVGDEVVGGAWIEEAHE